MKDSLARFASAAADPDGDSVCIRFDWGDGDTSDWGEYVEPDELVWMSHVWTAVAVCSLRAQARDRGSLTSTWSPAHAVNVSWSRTFGGAGDDCAYSVQQTSDGGYVVAGETDSYGAGESDVWLMKIDADGNKVWDRTFGGTSYDCGYSVQQTSDGGYIAAGETDSYGAGSGVVWLVKTDAAGNEVWDKTFGGEDGEDWDEGHSVRQTSDGGYIIAGTVGLLYPSKGDVWLIRTDASGNKVWDVTFGGENLEEGYSVQQTSDGGYIVVGETGSYGAGNCDVWLIKTDASGNKVWDRTFGGASYDLGRSAQQTSDGGYIVAGETFSYGSGSGDVWLIKTDEAGNKVWDKTLGGEDWDEGHSVQQTSDGGYIIAGATISYVTGDDVLLIKTSGP